MFSTEIDINSTIQVASILPTGLMFVIGIFGVIIKKFIQLMKG